MLEINGLAQMIVRIRRELIRCVSNQEAAELLFVRDEPSLGRLTMPMKRGGCGGPRRQFRVRRKKKADIGNTFWTTLFRPSGFVVHRSLLQFHSESEAFHEIAGTNFSTFSALLQSRATEHFSSYKTRARDRMHIESSDSGKPNLAR